MDGSTDRRTEGQTDGRMDGWRQGARETQGVCTGGDLGNLGHGVSRIPALGGGLNRSR